MNIPERTKKFILWSFAMLHLVLISLGCLAKILKWDHSQTLLSIGVICMAICWLAVFVEMYATNFYNRKFWLISMVIFPSISPVVYLIRRNTLKQNAFKRSNSQDEFSENFI
jgi:hypothetical protein